MTQRSCRACHGWHELSEPWPAQCGSHFRTEQPTTTVHIISDGMQALKHPATGKITDSKSVFRSHTKASGCIEVGNEPMKAQKPQHKMSNPRADIARALERY